MSYLPYVIVAYAIFAVVLLWDFVMPRLQRHRALRDARSRVARASRPRAATPVPQPGPER
ncbi:MAG: heme exporter protein CcmD [Pseudoxanthomonas sp.]